jgi:hypothetical protein
MEVSPSINFSVFLYFFIKLCWSFVSLIKYCTKFEALCYIYFIKNVFSFSYTAHCSGWWNLILGKYSWRYCQCLVTEINT